MKSTHTRDLASLQQRLLTTPLRVLLIPFSWLYAASVWVRNQLYALGVFRVRTLPCPVISVGNIVVGGTGKTPAVIAIARHLQRDGVRVAILLRGYKRYAREKVTIVSDGKKVCVSPRESGDEAHMMARHLSDIPIIVGKQRYLAGRVALARFNVDVLLLDDGYQHRQLGRDVDILTVPAHSIVGLQAVPKYPFGNPKGLLPVGTLREPPTALRRADIILLTHADAPNVSVYAKEAVEGLAPNALVLESIHQPTHLYPLISKNGGERTSIKELEGKRLLAVCGIGDPEAFVITLRRCSPERVELLAFPDHHVYMEADGEQICTAFQAAKADLIVTTQKDEQKLADLIGLQQLPVVVLAVALVVTEGDEKLAEVLLASVRGV